MGKTSWVPFLLEVRFDCHFAEINAVLTLHLSATCGIEEPVPLHMHSFHRLRCMTCGVAVACPLMMRATS